MHQSDFIQIVTIGLYRKLSFAPDDVLLQNVERALQLSLGRSDQFEAIRFVVDTSSDRQLNFLQWIDWARAYGAEEIELRQQGDFAIKPKRAQLEGKEIDQRYMSAFAGTHENVIALKLAQYSLGFRYQIEFPARTLITLDDLLGFIDAHPQERAYFHESMLWQNDHNLHLGEAKKIDQLIALLTPESTRQIVDSFSMIISNVSVSSKTREEWWAFWTANRNPAAPKHWVFNFGQAQLGSKRYVSLAKQNARLKKALLDILSYATKQKLNQFSAAFERALKCLDSTQAIDSNSPVRILAQLYPEKQFRLFAAISACGVFGGMGSWNDLGLEEDREYARVSNQLFKLRNELIEAGCNCANQKERRFSIFRFFRR